jgi:hypothetical protein
MKLFKIKLKNIFEEFLSKEIGAMSYGEIQRNITIICEPRRNEWSRSSGVVWRRCAIAILYRTGQEGEGLLHKYLNSLYGKIYLC